MRAVSFDERKPAWILAGIAPAEGVWCLATLLSAGATRFLAYTGLTGGHVSVGPWIARGRGAAMQVLASALAFGVVHGVRGAFPREPGGSDRRYDLHRQPRLSVDFGSASAAAFVAAVLALAVEREIVTEERQYMVLHAISHRTHMVSRIHVETVLDAVAVEDPVKFRRVGPEAVAIANIQCNGLVLTKIRDVLVHRSQGGVCRPSREHGGLGHTILRGKIEVERRRLGIR